MKRRKTRNIEFFKRMSHSVRKAIISCLSFFIAFSMFDLTVLAYTATITTGNRINYSIDVSGPDGSNQYGAYMDKIYIDGQLGFCIQPGHILVGGDADSYNLSYEDSEMLGIIQYQGYGRGQLPANEYSKLKC